MLQEFEAQNNLDEDNNPTGGFAAGVGFDITWQDGPLGRGDDRQEPNGAFVETILAVCKQRLEFYQTANAGKFNCHENAFAIRSLTAALEALELRTQRREAAGVEGTHAV